MSGLEVVGIVASVVSAFHGGAELVKLYKKRRAKKREKRERLERDAQEQDLQDAQDQLLQNMLHDSLEQGRAAVSTQFLDEQRALGRNSQLLRRGDDKAKQELLMIAVSLQAEVIESLGRAQHNLDIIVNMAQLQVLHETAITKRVEAVRSICELRQRIEFSLPIPRLSADMYFGVSRRSSNGSLANTFVTAAANLAIPEQVAQRHLPARLAPERHRSMMTLSSYKYLIPEIGVQDIEILTLAGEPIDHDYRESPNLPTTTNQQMLLTEPNPTSTSSSSSMAMPESHVVAHPFEVNDPYYITGVIPELPEEPNSPESHRISSLSPITSHTTGYTSPSEIRSSLETPISEPDSAISLRSNDQQKPYCSGALAAQDSFPEGIALHHLPILPGSTKLHPSWKCMACDFNFSDSDGALFSRIIFAHGVRFRFPFLARSHVRYKHPPDDLKPHYTYGCLFCTAEGRRSGVHGSADALAAHVVAKHRTNLTPEVRARTRCVVGRVAGKEEGWDVNLTQVTSRSGAGVGRWVLRAVTSLPT